jgi:hypothetical protein
MEEEKDEVQSALPKINGNGKYDSLTGLLKPTQNSDKKESEHCAERADFKRRMLAKSPGNAGGSYRKKHASGALDVFDTDTIKSDLDHDDQPSSPLKKKAKRA